MSVLSLQKNKGAGAGADTQQASIIEHTRQKLMCAHTCKNIQTICFPNSSAVNDRCPTCHQITRGYADVCDAPDDIPTTMYFFTQNEDGKDAVVISACTSPQCIANMDDHDDIVFSIMQAGLMNTFTRIWGESTCVLTKTTDNLCMEFLRAYRRFIDFDAILSEIEGKKIRLHENSKIEQYVQEHVVALVKPARE